MQADVLIMGQGIAGTVVAHLLDNAGQKVIIVDQPKLSSSSKVAAGLFNPIVLRFLTRSWKVPQLFPFAASFYPALEQKLQASFYHPLTLYKLMSEQDDLINWRKKLHRPNIAPYLMQEIQFPFDAAQVYYTKGGLGVRDTGWLDVLTFLESSKAYFENKGQLITDELHYQDIELTETGVQWKGYEAGKVVFCEGTKATQNPWFNWLPFKPTKGEVITIHAPELQVEHIISKAIFVLPLGNQHFKIGSTYNWEVLDEVPSIEAKEELLGKLDKIIKVPYTVVQHQAAVRPTVFDRRPFIGSHPEHQQCWIFNGLGSKGVTLAPYLANQMVRSWEDNTVTIDEETDISRFLHLRVSEP